MGLSGQHGERVGGLHAALRRVPKDQTTFAPIETEADGVFVQEVGGRGAGVDLHCGFDRVHDQQLLPRVDKEPGWALGAKCPSGRESRRHVRNVVVVGSTGGFPQDFGETLQA